VYSTLITIYIFTNYQHLKQHLKLIFMHLQTQHRTICMQLQKTAFD